MIDRVAARSIDVDESHVRTLWGIDSAGNTTMACHAAFAHIVPMLLDQQTVHLYTQQLQLLVVTYSFVNAYFFTIQYIDALLLLQFIV